MICQVCSFPRLFNTFTKPWESPGSPIGKSEGKRTHVHGRLSLPWKTARLHFSPICQKFRSHLPVWQVRTFSSHTLLNVPSSKAWALCSPNVLGVYPHTSAAPAGTDLQATFCHISILRTGLSPDDPCKRQWPATQRSWMNCPFSSQQGFWETQGSKERKINTVVWGQERTEDLVFSLTNTLLPQKVEVYPTFASVSLIKYRGWKQLSRRKGLWALYYPVLVRRFNKANTRTQIASHNTSKVKSREKQMDHSCLLTATSSFLLSYVVQAPLPMGWYHPLWSGTAYLSYQSRQSSHRYSHRPVWSRFSLQVILGSSNLTFYHHNVFRIIAFHCFSMTHIHVRVHIHICV